VGRGSSNRTRTQRRLGVNLGLTAPVAYMIYADHVLRVRVDWSSLDALNEKKFGVLKLHSLSVQFQIFHTLPFRSGSDEIPN
jgi:hypothetical protein